MKYTENYNLCKPENDDFYNVNQFNENADTIDTELKAHENAIETLRQEKNALSDIVYKKTVNSGVAADSDPNITTLAKVRTKHENCPTSNDIYTIITAFTDGTAEICEKFQYAINVGINYGKMYFRSKVYGLTTWSDWKEITTIDKVTAEQIGLGNVPNVTTNDQTPTYTVADTLVELVSGEKLSIAFGKIAKAISTLISHISAKATTSVFGHVKLSDSNAVTDSTGLALPATEKNASIAGTLAYQIINKTAIKSGNYKATMQADGNLVIYNTAEGTSIWDSNGQKATLSTAYNNAVWAKQAVTGYIEMIGVTLPSTTIAAGGIEDISTGFTAPAGYTVLGIVQYNMNSQYVIPYVLTPTKVHVYNRNTSSSVTVTPTIYVLVRKNL